LGRAGRFLGVGFEFAGTIVACVISGYYLDDYLGTSPLFILVLTLGGMTGALYRLLRMLRKVEGREKGNGS
jgi:F0F1-type ATP synthase assembly protein I